jgi:hypothetical protein
MSNNKGTAKPKKRYFQTLRRWIGFDHYLRKLRRWWRAKLRKIITKALGLESNDLVETLDHVAYNLLYEMTDIIENKESVATRLYFYPALA